MPSDLGLENVNASEYQITLWVERAPWRFLLDLQTINISHKKLAAFLVPQPDAGLDQLLEVGRPYLLQIDSDAGFQTEPTISAALVQKRSNAMGWELEFEFATELPR